MMAGMQNGNPDASAQTPMAVPSSYDDRRNAAGARICGSPKRKGGICQVSRGLGTNGRCRLHGGTQPVGPDNPNWKHGRRSKWLPANVMAAAEQDMLDPDFRRADLALSLLNRFMQEQASKAIAARKPDTKAAALRAFGDLAVKRSKVLTEEARRAQASADTMTRAQVGKVMAAFATCVRDAVMGSELADDVKRRILGDIQSAWKKGSQPLRTQGVTLPAEARTPDPQPAAPPAS